MFLKVVCLHTLKIAAIPRDPESPNSSWLAAGPALVKHSPNLAHHSTTNMLMSILAFNTLL